MKRRETALFGLLVLAAGLALVLARLSAPESGPRGGALDPVRAEPASSAPAPGELPALPPSESAPRRAEAARSVAPPVVDAPDGGGSGRIAGVALLEDGRTPAAGVHVLLSEGPAEPGARYAAELLARPDPRRLQRTDAEGRFLFVGLDPSRSYSIVLGGGGRVGAQPRWPVRADRPEGRYALHRLFAARLLLREEGGGALRLNAGLQGQRLGRGTYEAPAVQPLHGAPAGAVLAGLDPALLEGAPVSERLLLYTSAQPLEELAPIRFLADYPGYARLEAVVSARFVAAGLAEHTLALAPTARGFGALELEVRGWRGDCPIFESASGPAALLRLSSSQGEQAVFELRALAGTRALVEGLPYGTWRAQVMLGSRTAGSSRRQDATRTLEIGPAPARYELDLAQSGSLVLEVLDARGQPHRGHVSFLYSLDAGPTRAWRTQHFLEPPYRLDELEPGPYRLVLQIPYGAGTSAQSPLYVRVQGGDCTRVELRE